MNYRRAPSDVYDDAEAMQRWAALAVEAGLRGAAKKSRGSRPLIQDAHRSSDERRSKRIPASLGGAA